jgi:hypothetical protein
MKLKKVTILGYASVKQEVTLHVEDRITILIGANDGGKSNILKAIRCLNDDGPFDLREKNWDLGADAEPFIEWTFQLSAAERQELALSLEGYLRDQGKSINVTDFPGIQSLEITEGASDAESLGPTTTHAVITARHAFSGELLIRRPLGRPLEIKLSETIAEPSIQHELEQGLLRKRPRVELFTPSEQLTDVISQAQLDQSNEEFMQGIFRYAGIWEERKDLFSQSPVSEYRLSQASAKFTDRIRTEWQQGENLSFRLSHAGQNGDHIQLYIGDPSVEKRFVRPSERSEGFSAFFKMSMRLLARTESTKATTFLFLFDEPGTALHPAGQVNLLRVFERLANDNQIIYSTHSLFMINHNRPQRNRVISKSGEGTKIDQKPFLKNWRAVKDSLGLILAGTFFIADRTLLVEGESDAMYVGALLGAYDRAGRMDVDLNLFSVQWAGNEKDFAPMARLLLEEGREVVVLVDGDNGGDKLRIQIERLNAGITREQSSLKPVDVIQIPASQSIEDILPVQEQYFYAVSQAALELVQNGLRQLAADAPREVVSMSAALAVGHAGKTLGKHVADVSASWFSEHEPISKLAIARNYITWLESVKPDELGLAELPATLQAIVEKLRLGSKQTDRAVFERR